MNRDEYMSKINNILSDESKFQRITRDPTLLLKQKTNKIIDSVNAVNGAFKLNKISGEYSPGYIYGNVKTHKNNNPLRPIISQIPTPTYNLSKTLNNIITPYMPNRYTVKSSNDFIDLLRTSTSEGIIASLDVESLFTNVPVDDTIKIILQYTYHHPTIPPPKIPKNCPSQLLQLCTKESPFRSPDGKLYVQIEGVAMGSPLGPTFANYYMGHLEETVFSNVDNKPHIYCRYVDDIFIQTSNEDSILHLKQLFTDNSKLNFTYEMNTNNKLPFLDVLVNNTNTHSPLQYTINPTT